MTRNTVGKRRTIRKRANGNGSIFQLKDGSWRAVVSCGQISGKRIRKTKKAATRDAAKVALTELQLEVSGGLPVSTDLTIATWLSEWLEACKADKMADNTIISYELAIKNHLVPKIGAAKISEISSVQIDKAFRELKAGSRTRELAFTILSAAMNRAKRKGLITSNPCNDADRPSYTPEEIVPLSQNDVERILKAKSADRLHAVYVLAFSYGPRQGEMFGLRWCDVDLKNRRVRFVQQACETSGKLIFKKLKTKAAARTIVISEAVASAIQSRRLIAMREGHASSELVFTSEDGTAIRRSNFGNRQWRPLLKSLGIGHCGFHNSRHTAASLMLGAGVPLHVVSKILGHAKPSITLDLYSHLMTHQSEEAASVIDKMIG